MRMAMNGQRRVKVGEQRAPGHHRREDVAEAEQRRDEKRVPRQPLEAGCHLVPLAVQRQREQRDQNREKRNPGQQSKRARQVRAISPTRPGAGDSDARQRRCQNFDVAVPARFGVDDRDSPPAACGVPGE